MARSVWREVGSASLRLSFPEAEPKRDFVQVVCRVDAQEDVEWDVEQGSGQGPGGAGTWLQPKSPLSLTPQGSLGRNVTVVLSLLMNGG